MKNFNVLSNPKKIYNSMIDDINNSKNYVYLETYIFDDDKIGKRFRDVLIKKLKQGVRVRLLIDAWGSNAKIDFFKKLIDLGAEVRYFREIRYFIRIFTKNHERNHRKLLIIDDNISYIGSMNITEDCLEWRELVLRLEGIISISFKHSFLKSWEIYGHISRKKIRSIIYKDFEIIHDIPSFIKKATENKYLRLIKKAKKNIRIETPYFVPSLKIINAFSKAVKRKVNVELIVPYYSDVRIVDILRNRYLGRLSKKGINIYYYNRILHSKLLIIDDNYFLLGSSNLDYRSFNYQYEINFIGTNKKMICNLKEHFNETLSDCFPFDYNHWKRRSSFKKILEIIMLHFKHYF